MTKIKLISLFTLSISTFVPIVSTSCSTTKELKLNLSDFSGITLIENGDVVPCNLTATYGNEKDKLATVTFGYSKNGIISASWKQAKQQVEITPLAPGDVDLTLYACDEKGYTATSVVSLTVDTDTTTHLALSVNIDENQNWGNDTSYLLTATFGASAATLSSVNLTSGSDNVLTASWNSSTNKIQITPTGIGTTTLRINATDNNGHTATKTINSINVDSKVHEFINDRTFSLRGYKNSSGSFGTMWLWYHETNSSKANNNYTYYALTNNHVTSGLDKMGSSAQIAFAYQDWDSAKDETKRINEWTSSTTGEPNVYNTIQSSNWTSSSSKFRTLFTSYLSSSGYNFYRDMTICKIDFGAFTGNATLKARLDRLNTYGSSGTHNGYLVEFDDYSDVTSTSQNTTLFAGGYPLKTMGPDTPESIYSDSTVKFQKQLFKNNKPNYFSNLNSMISYFDWYAGYYGLSTVYNAKHTLQSNGCLFSPDWEGEKNYDPATPFGGGASGSLAIKASDPSDVTTYKASGIYWGGWHPSSSATWWFEPYFSPFTLNFGKNINEITYLNIIDQFMNSAAFTTNTPTDDCCYTAS